ncbi:MAG TPA: TonB-dependent receptor [Bacteriovoracaceae bacterium]|nr:TonB-dependent receptor [Bacteriovoracaceae bacterium]
MYKSFLLFLIISFAAGAQEALETVVVTEDHQSNIGGYWEENRGTQIYSGKKNTITSLKEIPQLQTNNYRQATSQTAGLLVSEVPNESLAGITYRGLGDPHESYNVLLLQDGIPVAADMYGYPAHYFSPALPMMDKVQFIRGGASLLYGPQPGGVLNYMSSPLIKDQPLSGRVGITGGSYNLLTTNNVLKGSTGNHSYAVEYYRRQGEGLQRKNSDFSADYVQIRDHIFDGSNKYKFSFNGYNSDHGNPGGFAKNPGANRNVFGGDRGKATKLHDRLKVSRAQLAAGVEKKLAGSSEIHVNLWATAYKRFSKTQNGGGFGTIPTGPTAGTNNIVTQNYYGFNGEVRYLRNYRAFDNEHTFSAGYLNYNLLSPIVTEVGAGPASNTGAVARRLDRATHTNSLFVENRFSIGKLMVTPGVRVENIRQKIEERKKPSGTLRDADETVTVPLFGLGVAYHLNDFSQVYANASEAYKPVTYSEAVPLDDVATISEDIDPSRIYNYELGYRGQTEVLNWDVSAFFIRYENKFGKVGANFQNTGAGTNKGLDLTSEVKLSEIFSILKPAGNFNLYGNMEYLDAEYTRGPQKGKTPQYAPEFISRAGLIYGVEDSFKVALMGVMVSKHYGDDGNSADFRIPFYTVWDLTADWNFTREWTASGGVNNLLDREYTSRIRADGIAWSLGRNLYAGVTYKF